MEGLAYLTLDADVKDDFVQDIPALQAMFELAKASVALTCGLRSSLPDSGSRGPTLSLGNGTPVSSFWFYLLSLCKPGLVISLFLALILPDCKMGSQLFIPSRQWEDGQQTGIFS